MLLYFFLFFPTDNSLIISSIEAICLFKILARVKFRILDNKKKRIKEINKSVPYFHTLEHFFSFLDASEYIVELLLSTFLDIKFFFSLNKSKYYYVEYNSASCVGDNYLVALNSILKRNLLTPKYILNRINLVFSYTVAM